MSAIEKLATFSKRNDALPLARKMLAIVALSLALDRADAGEPITGSATDGHLVVEWEYDLDAATGVLNVENIDAQNYGYPFAFDHLIPEDAATLECNGIPSVLTECQSCASAIPCPDLLLYRYLPPGSSFEVTFDLPQANWNTTLAESSFNYAPGNIGTSAVCRFFDEQSTIPGFVTVTPLEIQNCNTVDLDNDGDVDLQDFAEFQNRFTGPIL